MTDHGAGTIRPASVLVLGAGVAGLQAIATARRLGAQVTGYDVRPEVAEQVQSLGAKFLDVGVNAAGEGGYARELTDEELVLRVREAKEELFNLRFQMATGQLDNNRRLRTVRHDIARIYTVMRERELGLSAAPSDDEGAA